MKFQTESGSVYEIDGDHIRRVNTLATKRADGEWLRMVTVPEVELGQPVRTAIESLAQYGPDDEGNETGEVDEETYKFTYRVTTPVERIWGNDRDN